MAKDPAFLFYPNDWIGGTMGMTFEEKGAYMELLMLQFNRGHMTKHMIGQTVGQIWDKVKEKFIEDGKGLFYNQRLELEKSKRAKFTESRRNNVSGTNQHSNKSVKNGKKRNILGGHMTLHMENENENENKEGIIKNWEFEKTTFLNDGAWMYKFCTSKEISLEKLEKLMDNFIKNIDLAEDHKTSKELKNHFTNLFNKNSKMPVLMKSYEPKSTAPPLKIASDV